MPSARSFASVANILASDGDCFFAVWALKLDGLQRASGVEALEHTAVDVGRQPAAVTWPTRAPGPSPHRRRTARACRSRAGHAPRSPSARTGRAPRHGSRTG